MKTKIGHSRVQSPESSNGPSLEHKDRTSEKANRFRFPRNPTRPFIIPATAITIPWNTRLEFGERLEVHTGERATERASEPPIEGLITGM